MKFSPTVFLTALAVLLAYTCRASGDISGEQGNSGLTPGGTARALVVLIGRYPPASGWGKLHCGNDMELITRLLGRIGCPEENITVLTDSAATKKAVTAALVSLERATGEGDRVYIHFSCHGQQMVDDDGDEPDGLDEALVMYDARRRFVEGVYEGENHLRDDELGRHLDRIRTAAGGAGNVTVVFDACHSGTADRAAHDEYIRGTTYVFGSEAMQAPVPEPSKVKRSPTALPHMAPLTVYAACRPHEANYEYRDPATGRYYGSLTFALNRVAGRGGALKKPLTPSALNERLCAEIKRMFSGKRHTQTPFFETTDDSKVSIFTR